LQPDAASIDAIDHGKNGWHRSFNVIAVVETREIDDDTCALALQLVTGIAPQHCSTINWPTAKPSPNRLLVMMPVGITCLIQRHDEVGSEDNKNARGMPFPAGHFVFLSSYGD